MADDLLTTFRSQIPPPDDTTARRIYERATSGRRRFPRQRFVVAVAGAAVGALVAAVAASGVFTSSTSHSPNGDQISGGLDVNYVQIGGALSSIAVTLNLNIANASVQLQVVHTDATRAEAYAGKAQTQVVFQEDVPTTTAVASPSKVSTWSGTLSPSQWSAGCQSGLYQIRYLAIPPGRTFANATEQPGSEFGAGEWFRCNGG